MKKYLQFIQLKKPVLLVLLLAAGITDRVLAQEPGFSQFFDAPLSRNPALAGLFEGDIRIQGVYRNQLSSVTTPYITNSLNAEYKRPVGKGNDFITLGLEMMYDEAATINFRTTRVFPALNYHKSLNDTKTKYLSAGFMAGWVNKRIDRTKITTNNQYDGYGYNPAIPDGEIFPVAAYNYWDGGVGISFNSSINNKVEDNYYIGIAYHHLNRPVNSFYRNPAVELQPRWVVSGGIRFTANEVSYVTLQADFSKEGSLYESIGGVLFSRKIGSDYENPDFIVHAGALLRWKDAFIPVVKLDYGSFSAGLSYDILISGLKTASQGRGGFELSVGYTGFTSSNNSDRKVMVCPRF